MIRKKLLRTLALPAALLLGQAQAASVGGFDIGAFANSVTGITGSLTFTGPSLTGAATDQSADTFITALTTPSTLGLGFASGTLVNGTSNDLVLFGLGTTTESFDLTIGSTTNTLNTVNTGFTTTGGFQLNAIAVNLDAYGIAANAGVTDILLTFTDTTSEFALAGALNPPPAVVPVPAAVWLFGSGLLGFAGVARRRK